MRNTTEAAPMPPAPAVRLCDVALSRDNNLNLIRFLAASAVLASHSYALALGDPQAEPLRAALGMTPGAIAVDLFFVISGFLVTASLHRRPDLLGFVSARALRIFPGLLVMLVLTALVAGPLLSSLDTSAYFTDSRLHRYLWKAATLLFGIQYLLPGVFEHNPYGAAVNGSLWTLPVELRCYLALAGLWLASRQLGARAERAFTVGLTGLAVIGLLLVDASLSDPQRPPTTLTMLAMFAIGAACFRHRQRIVLDGRLGLTLAAALPGLAAWAPASTFWLAYALSLPYIALCAAYLPGGVLRRFNAVGDYSYGIYIYAFPVQQAVVALVPGVGPWQLTALAFPPVLVAAMLSWHGVESRAVALARGRRQPTPAAQPLTPSESGGQTHSMRPWPLHRWR